MTDFRAGPMAPASSVAADAVPAAAGPKATKARTGGTYVADQRPDRAAEPEVADPASADGQRQHAGARGGGDQRRWSRRSRHVGPQRRTGGAADRRFPAAERRQS